MSTTTAATTSAIARDSQLEISSGAMCFGGRREVMEGSNAEMQDPSCLEFQSGGAKPTTVLSHAFQYNLKALTGKWNVYKLVRQQQQQQQQQHSSSRRNVGAAMINAAFCVHESLAAADPYDEAKRIVDVANAPWEKDNGTNHNNRNTWEGRVVVINRYDWMEDYYAEQEDGITQREEDLVGGGKRNSRWLVDYEKAKNEVSWDEWCASGKGVRLVVFGEYLYGRFGLVEDRSMIQSFLLFTADTQLARTTFRGDDRPIYIPLTEEQRHVKCLANGTYTGYAWLQTASHQQLPEDLVDPFGVDDMIDLETMETLLQSVQPTVPRFEPQLQQDTAQLLNESLAVWAYRLGRFAEGANSRDDFILDAFPNSLGNNERSIHSLQLKAMERNDSLKISEDALHKIVAPDSKLWTFLTIEEVSCGLKFLLKEILELSGNCARENERKMLVPYDVRVSIHHDRELSDECLNRSKVFWPPDMVSD